MIYLSRLLYKSADMIATRSKGLPNPDDLCRYLECMQILPNELKALDLDKLMVKPATNLLSSNVLDRLNRWSCSPPQECETFEVLDERQRLLCTGDDECYVCDPCQNNCKNKKCTFCVICGKDRKTRCFCYSEPK